MLRVSKEELSILRLPERIPASEIVKHINISGTTNVLDHIDLDLTPYLKLPISLIGKSDVFVIGFVGPTQAGKSVFLQCAVADTILQDPGTIIYIFPDEKSAKKAIEDKIIGMVERTPSMLEKVKEPKSRNLNVSTMRFRDMNIYPGWAGSLGALSSTPAKRVFLDEVRLMPTSIGEESNAIKLATDRLTTFRQKGMAQMYIVSTPSVEGDLLHQQLDVHGTTYLHWYSKCPSCGKFQILDFFDNVKFDKDTNKVTCRCKFCEDGVFSDDNMKQDWNNNGQYQVEGWEGYRILPEPELTDRVFFHMSIETPFRPFTMIWDEFLKTKGNIKDYKNFYQAWLAKWWRLTVSTLTKADMTERIGELPRGVVPDKAKVIVCGGDTQDNGFYLTFRAFGSGRETWLIDSIFLPCDIKTTSTKALVKLFKENIEDRIFSKQDGEKWQVGLWALDVAGHRTTEIYDAEPYLSKLHMVMGRNSQKETVQFSENRNTLYFVRTEEFLDLTETECVKKYWHLYSEVDQDYLDQFLNAKKIKEENKKTGIEKTTWMKDGQNDYRMAEVHAFIAIDLPHGSSTIRRKLESDWVLNPYNNARKVKEPQYKIEDHEESRSIDSNSGEDYFNESFFS